jgi:hypothetical protein
VEAVVRVGAVLPFEQAPDQIAFFTGVTLSRESARRLTETAGAQLVAVEEADLTDLRAALPAPPVGPAVQQLSVDGAMVPLVGGVWSEVKLLTIGTVTPAAAERRPQTTDLSYLARLADADRFAEAATLETHRRGTATAGTVAAVLDGAAWLQGFVDLHRPDAVRILDFPHAAQHLGAAGAAVWGDGSAATRRWTEQAVCALRAGERVAVLEAVACLPVDQAPDPAAAATRVQETVGYLAARWEQVDYGRFRAAGLPIGSGCVESGHKVVTQARLKGPGMHWAAANVNPLLALRCALLNGRWAEAWPRLVRRWRQAGADRARTRRAARRGAPAPAPAPAPAACPAAAAAAAAAAAPPPAPPPAPSRPKTIVDGRPTAAHPWKRQTRLPRSGAPARAKR